MGFLGLLGRCQVIVVNWLISGSNELSLGVLIGVRREIRGNTVYWLNAMDDVRLLILGSGILIGRGARRIDYGSLIDRTLVVRETGRSVETSGAERTVNWDGLSVDYVGIGWRVTLLILLSTGGGSNILGSLISRRAVDWNCVYTLV